MGSLRWFTALLLASLSVGCGDGATIESETPNIGAAIPAREDGAAGDRDATPAPPVPKIATVRVHYPVGSRKLVLKGEQAPLTTAGTPLSDIGSDTWELSLGETSAPVSFVLALDDAEARGGKYVVSPGETLDVYPHFAKAKGQVAVLPGGIASKILGNTHGVRVYLPPSYKENTAARYPVVYMHDGQIIFDAELVPVVDGLAKTAFFGSWKTEKVLDEAAEAGTLAEAIVVGIDLIFEVKVADPGSWLRDLTKHREQELTPTRFDDNPMGRADTGKGPAYLRMIAEELKPKIDSLYRTFPDRDHTVIAGASLGGLMSIWAGIDNGDVFGRVLAMSSSTWWDGEIAARRVEAERGGPKKSAKIYSDTGDDETAQSSPTGDANDKKQVDESERLWRAYRAAGYADGATLMTVVAPGGQHKGSFWSQRVGPALGFLLGTGGH